MQKHYLLFVFFIFSISFAQDDFEKLVQSEKKSAASKIAFVPNPNTANYNVTYHKLEFTVDPAQYFIAGKVTTTFEAVNNLSTITFDLANELTVSSVMQSGSALTFSRSASNELIINLLATVVAGTSATVEITYSGAPPVNGFDAFTINTRPNGSKTLFTLSEPFGARDWWPCKQDLNDKINSIDVYITAPSQYVSVSNGIERSAVVTGVNKTTWFTHNYPIPAYLICMAVTNYSVFNQPAAATGLAFPIVNYLYAENNTSAVQTQLAQTPLIMNLYENLFEPYPFRNEKYGHAQFGWGGGMEHTTVSFMYNFSRNLIAHELAHQWFGDKITCGSWNNIWLNEGFATYLTALVVENFDGLPAYITYKNNMINLATSTTGAVYLTDVEATDVNRIFSNQISYNKGAMVLNMLRFKMGNAAFFQALKNYLANPNLAYKYAVTTDLKTHLEAAYGSNLDEFFNDWVYKQGYPSYSITAQNWGAGQAKIVVSQTQSDPISVPFFEMPVPVRLKGAAGEVLNTVLENTTNGQEFLVPITFTITAVEFDPEKNLLSKNNIVSLGSQFFTPDQILAAYPNPVTSELHIQKPSDVVVLNNIIINALGQKVIETPNLSFSVENLENGVYYLEIETSQGIYHKKIIKK